MYYIREVDIKAWCAANSLEFISCACRVTERRDGADGSKRAEIKKLIAQLKQVNPQVEGNIFHSVMNVELTVLNTVMGILSISAFFSIAARFSGL